MGKFPVAYSHADHCCQRYVGRRHKQPVAQGSLYIWGKPPFAMTFADLDNVVTIHSPVCPG
ncbi:MAG: hypothetical protein WKG07_38170 [Hymenobacter sp.]